jgi:hypothetical protein
MGLIWAVKKVLTKQIDAYIIIIVPSEERRQKLFKKVVDKVISV